MNSERLPAAVLISGGGRTLQNLLDCVGSGTLDLDVRLVLSSHRQARGLEIAASAGIPTQVALRARSADDAEYSQTVFGACRAAGARLVVMAGFIKYVPIPADFENRVTNIHPGLIPAFCGKGFYGQHVHQAVLDYGAKISGCTVHFVDNQYDHGPIILQRVVPVEDDDTAETLAARVFAAECQAYPEALQLIAQQRLQVVGRRVVRTRP